MYCTVYTQYTVCTVHCTVYSTHSILCVHCTVHREYLCKLKKKICKNSYIQYFNSKSQFTKY